MNIQVPGRSDMIENNKNNPSVSVIIPMYKCASFVSDMLDMVCGQTFKDIEIICVLDGSDKDIRSIIEDRAKEDARIILLEQEHGGAGTARNTGMDVAQGDYLLFLDADDLFEPIMIERMYSEAVKYDAETVMCSYSQTNEWTKVSVRGIGFDYSLYPEGEVIDCTKKKDLWGSFIGAPWNKLFKRQLVEKLDIHFSSTMVMNDVLFVTAVMTCTKRLVVIKEDLLTTRRYVNTDSISSNRSKHNEDSLVVFDEVYRWIKSNGYWRTRREDYYKLIMNALHYEAGYDCNEQFIEGMARMLSKDRPWTGMCNAEVIQVLDMRIGKIATMRNNQLDSINANKNQDNSGRKQKLRRTENKLKAFREIRSLMKNKYGRDITKRDNVISWISWSVRFRGWKETVRRIKEKAQGEILLEPYNVICSGHITTAGHYLTFFLPTETYREEASVEEISVVVRCNGYYPTAVSGKNGDNFTSLGPLKTPVINGSVPTRNGEVMRAYCEVSPGLGIFVQIRFKEALLKNHQGDPAGNNQPVSVQITGKIRLK